LAPKTPKNFETNSKKKGREIREKGKAPGVNNQESGDKGKVLKKMRDGREKISTFSGKQKNPEECSSRKGKDVRSKRRS